MASLSFARPGKFSARQYLGDLAGLFERQRRRAGVALTPESFAADLAANDTLGSGLFTLCSAISRMGENDLSPEELLDLIARALGGAGSAEGEAGTNIPPDMREAFLSGYAAWQRRDAQNIGLPEPEAWPPLAAGARKPAAAEAIAHPDVTGRDLSAPSIPSPGRRTVQEALGRVHSERTAEINGSDLQSQLRAADADAPVNVTVGELKLFLEEMEHRARLAPHHPQENSAASPAIPDDREHSASKPGGVIPFPTRRGKSTNESHEDPHTAGLDLNADLSALIRRRSVSDTAARLKDTDLSHAPNVDDRPPGIDALLAAATTWASATPTARSYDEETFLSRHAYLSPARRPVTVAPAALYYPNPEPQASPQAPAPDPRTQPELPEATTPASTSALSSQEFAPSIAPHIGLDTENGPPPSPAERLLQRVLTLSPRKLFLALAGLTILAGALAGWMAYHTLHSGHAPQFQDLEPIAEFGTPSPVAPAPTRSSAVLAQSPSASIAPKTEAAKPTPAPAPKPSAAHRLDASGLQPPVAVWPPASQQLARDSAYSPLAAAPIPAATAPVQPNIAATPYIPPPTMIGYALATPQPAYPASQPRGITGTVAVETTVSRLGDVTSAHAVSGPAQLRAAAVAAVRGWRFRPYLINGRPVEVSTTLQFFFNGE